MQKIAAALAFALALQPTNGTAFEACKTWGQPEKLGTLDVKIMPEASGIAVSRQFPGRLYHNNDSGDGPNFYTSDMSGSNMQTVSVSGFTPIDVEDIALGKCGRGTCLYLGDIGDNQSQRENVKFVLVSEKETYTSPETPLRIITAKYPDGAHDAEGFAIHPDGDLFLITKPMDWNQHRAGVAQLFKLSAKQLAVSDGTVQTFTAIADLDLPWLLWISGASGQIVSAFDIAPDGKRFVMLTYQSALEVEHDLADPLPPLHSWQPFVDFSFAETAKLLQAEAIAYLPDGSLIYDTESAGTPDSPLYKQACTAH